MPPVYRHFRRTKQFRKSFDALEPNQQALAVAAFKKFKVNPFDPSLGTHRIHKLSARLGCTVYSVVLDGDLRSLFVVDKDVVTSIDIGTHAVYR